MIGKETVLIPFSNAAFIKEGGDLRRRDKRTSFDHSLTLASDPRGVLLSLMSSGTCVIRTRVSAQTQH